MRFTFRRKSIVYRSRKLVGFFISDLFIIITVIIYIFRGFIGPDRAKLFFNGQSQRTDRQSLIINNLFNSTEDRGNVSRQFAQAHHNDPIATVHLCSKSKNTLNCLRIVMIELVQQLQQSL